jgi:hypothetical protein
MRTPCVGRWKFVAATTIALAILPATASFSAEKVRVASVEFELPKQVTPAVRAACEGDVRRFCVRKGSTLETVKTCVYTNFSKLNAKCQELALAVGFTP